MLNQLPKQPKLIINPNDPAIKGGVPLQRVPVIPWSAFVSCGMHVYVEEKLRPAIFDPKPAETADEVMQVMRFLLAAQQKRPGPIDWKTVPESVKRHFRFSQDASAVERS